MKRTLFNLVAAAMAIAATAQAGSPDISLVGYSGCSSGCPTCEATPICNSCQEYSSCCEQACSDCCDDCCEHGHWLLEGELTFFRYHRADGIRVGDDPPGDDVTSNPFQAAPRITFGYIGADGLGVRARWWDYDMNTDPVEGAPSQLSVDTYNFDLEVFDRVQLNCAWIVEISAGIRYNSFDETLLDIVGEAAPETRLSSFNGFGGLVGLELRRCIGSSLTAFARVRGAILMDDKFVSNTGSGPVLLLDSTQGMAEIALGVQTQVELGNGALLYGGVSGEWQNWFNYSSNFTTSAVDPEQFYTGASDVGFGGFVFTLGLVY